MNYHVTDQKKVNLADGTELDVLGRGEDEIKTPKGMWLLKNVRYIPGQSKQLILISQLDKERHHMLRLNVIRSYK